MIYNTPIFPSLLRFPSFIRYERVSMKDTLDRSFESLQDYFIVDWAAHLLKIICKSRVIIGKKHFISDKKVAKIIEKHLIMTNEVKEWLTPHLLMNHLHFVPVMTDCQGVTWWMEPCLTPLCDGHRPNGTLCTYGHPSTPTKADMLVSWR